MTAPESANSPLAFSAPKVPTTLGHFLPRKVPTKRPRKCQRPVGPIWKGWGKGAHLPAVKGLDASERDDAAAPHGASGGVVAIAPRKGDHHRPHPKTPRRRALRGLEAHARPHGSRGALRQGEGLHRPPLRRRDRHHRCWATGTALRASSTPLARLPRGLRPHPPGHPSTPPRPTCGPRWGSVGSEHDRPPRMYRAPPSPGSHYTDRASPIASRPLRARIWIGATRANALRWCRCTMVMEESETISAATAQDR
jgi:hypothetical protein